MFVNSVRKIINTEMRIRKKTEKKVGGDRGGVRVRVK